MTHAEPAAPPPRRRRVVVPTSDPARVPHGAIGGLAPRTLALVSFSTLAAAAPAASPPQDHSVLQERALVAPPAEGGGLRIEDAASGGVVIGLPPEAAGFPGGPRRALVRAPRRSDGPAAASARPARWADGRLTQIDPAPGWRAEPLGSGRADAEAFARLL